MSNIHQVTKYMYDAGTKKEHAIDIPFRSKVSVREFINSSTTEQYSSSYTFENFSHSSALGLFCDSSTEGSHSHSFTSGQLCKSSTNGSHSYAVTAGGNSKSSAKGVNSIACALGWGSVVRGAIGTILILMEYAEERKSTTIDCSSRFEPSLIKCDDKHKVSLVEYDPKLNAIRIEFVDSAVPIIIKYDDFQPTSKAEEGVKHVIVNYKGKHTPVVIDYADGLNSIFIDDDAKNHEMHIKYNAIPDKYEREPKTGREFEYKRKFAHEQIAMVYDNMPILIDFTHAPNQITIRYGARFKPIRAISEIVGQNGINPDTWYTIENGKFTKVGELAAKDGE